MEAKKNSFKIIIPEPFEKWMHIIRDVNSNSINRSYISGFTKEEYDFVSKAVNHHDELVEALEGFVKSCYSGCSKNELDELRIKAESVLSKLK